MVNDYPTNARADYVFVCMATNGQTREMLDRCSCAIDQIATILPYDDYVRAETVMRMRQTPGERVGMFRQGTMVNDMVAPQRRGAANATLMTMLETGIFCGVLLTGRLYESLGWSFVYSLMAVFIVVAAVVFLFWAHPHYLKVRTALREAEQILEQTAK